MLQSMAKTKCELELNDEFEDEEEMLGIILVGLVEFDVH